MIGWNYVLLSPSHCVCFPLPVSGPGLDGHLSYWASAAFGPTESELNVFINYIFHCRLQAEWPIDCFLTDTGETNHMLQGPQTVVSVSKYMKNSVTKWISEAQKKLQAKQDRLCCRMCLFDLQQQQHKP